MKPRILMRPASALMSAGAAAAAAAPRSGGVRAQELDPSKTYIFGYHPHGIISLGALVCFDTLLPLGDQPQR